MHQRFCSGNIRRFGKNRLEKYISIFKVYLRRVFEFSDLFVKNFLKVFVNSETDLGFLLYFFEIQEVWKPKGYQRKLLESQNRYFQKPKRYFRKPFRKSLRVSGKVSEWVWVFQETDFF